MPYCVFQLQDLEQFHGGDSSLVGERGLVLSGGQKARINLARLITQFISLSLIIHIKFYVTSWNL